MQKLKLEAAGLGINFRWCGSCQWATGVPFGLFKFVDNLKLLCKLHSLGSSGDSENEGPSPSVWPRPAECQPEGHSVGPTVTLAAPPFKSLRLGDARAQAQPISAPAREVTVTYPFMQSGQWQPAMLPT